MVSREFGSIVEKYQTVGFSEYAIEMLGLPKFSAVVMDCWMLLAPSR